MQMPAPSILLVHQCQYAGLAWEIPARVQQMISAGRKRSVLLMMENTV
jgi:hypothetical protein